MKKLLVMLVACCFFFAGCTASNNYQSIGTNPSQAGTNSAADIEDNQLIKLQLGSVTLTTEAVTSVESITKGLGEREEIGSDGMVFFLPDRRVATFWMKGMQFPLDMVWIDGNSVVGVTSDIPVHTGDSDFPTYSSPSEVTHVLELPAGDAQRRGIKKGDQVLVTSN